MKKIVSIFTIALMLMIPISASAQCGRYLHRHGNALHRHYSCVNDKHKHGRSFWQKHRDKVTVAAGTGTGAILGAVFGGKKGAAVGAIVGGGGAAIYTYGIRKRRKSASHYRMRCTHC